ncbi:MAG: structural protein [Phycisphaerae bacterium]|jgi:hypothetical protein
MAARGERNNNPGNIEANATKWRGLADPPVEPEGRFARFTEAKWGIRAIARTLQSYQTKHGLRTIREVISRWAPAVENNTKGYIDRVAQDMGVTPDSRLDLFQHKNAKPLVLAIMRVELGYEPPYSDAVVEEALALAGVTP